MIAKAWDIYRRYFLDHLPAHFIGFAMGVAFMGFITGAMLSAQCYSQLTSELRHR